MEPKQNYLLVGLFVLLGTAAIFGFSLWLSGANDRRSYDPYRIDFTESVNGLSIGSAVKYRGVVVGKVEHIDIDPKNPERIVTRVSIAEGTPITGNTVANLKFQGVTGVLYVELSGGGADAPPLTAKNGEELPVIPSEPSQLSQIVTTLPELIDKFSETAERLNRLASDDNLTAVSRTLANLDRVTAALDANARSFDVLVRRLADTTQTIDGFARASRGDAEQAVRQSRVALEEFSLLLRTTNQFAGYGYPELSSLMTDLRQTSRDLSELSRGLKERPSQMLFPPKEEGVKIP